MKCGIIGGTFDPIHFGHLFIAEEVRVKLELDKIIFIPTGSPPHKEIANITKPKQRFDMTVLATESNPHFYVSSIEQDLKGINYTIDTLKAIKKVMQDISEIYFIVGADTLLQLHTWKNMSEILELCKFVVVSRPGFKSNEVDEEILRLEAKYGAKFINIETTSLEISSTEIRKRIKNSENIKYTLPESVEEYIVNNGLYMQGEI